MDRLTPAERSRLMSKIRSKNTTPELLVRRYLYAHGLRYRLHDKHFPGRPDLYLPRYKVAVEVRGCFWHRHPGCKVATMPKSHKAFWRAKFARNVARDHLSEVKIRAMGVRLLVVWECELVASRREATLAELLRLIVAPTPADLDLTALASPQQPGGDDIPSVAEPPAAYNYSSPFSR